MEKISNSSKEVRIVSIDVLRGLMLVIMSLNHFGGFFKGILYQPIGFVSGAGGFIFLSGYLYGLVYTKKIKEKNYKYIKSKSFRRASVIYFYHILILIIVFVPIAIYGIDTDLIFKNKINVQSILFYLVFLNQPENMDILPLYVIFLLVGPIIIRAFNNNNAKLVFLISGLLWFMGQWKIFQYNSYNLEPYGFYFGYFNLFCWQLLFFIGCYIGYLKSIGEFYIPITRKLVYFVIGVFIILIYYRYSEDKTILWKIFNTFSYKPVFGIVRFVNFFVIAYLLHVLITKNEGLIKSRWLAFLGRHSLQVFAFSICLAYFYLQFEPLIKSYHFWVEIVIQLLLIFSLSIPAYLHKLAVKNVPFIKSLGL